MIVHSEEIINQAVKLCGVFNLITTHHTIFIVKLWLQNY